MFQKLTPCLAILICFQASFVIAQDDGKAKDAKAETKSAGPQRTDTESIGYFLGVSVGQQMSQNGIQMGDFDLNALMAGFEDGLSRKEAAMGEDELKETQQKIQALLERRLREKGEKYLAANAKKEGVKVLEAGLQYKVLEAGEGESPGETDTVEVHYTGKLINGTVFDSSVKRGEPATFRVNQVIKGWQMALQKMKVGDKWMLYIPSDLAYGERGSPGGIGPHEVLTFEVELLEIK